MATDPYRLVNGAASNVYAIAASIYHSTRATASHIWIGRGLDPTAPTPEHRTGRALDVIITPKVGQTARNEHKRNGDKLANALIAIAKTAHIRHIIWYGRIYRARYANWGTTASVKGTHMDHIHILFDDNNGRIPETLKFDGAPTITPTPTVRPFSISNVWQAIQTGRYDGNTTTIQALLNKLGFKCRVDGYFGNETARAYAAYQRSLGYTGQEANGTPGKASLTKLLAPNYYVV